MKLKWMGAPAFALALGVLMVSCNKESLQSDAALEPALKSSSGNAGFSGKANSANSFYGPQVQMGNGRARSFIVLEKNGMPLEIGAELTEGAMYGLPEDPSDFEAAAFLLPLHQKAQQATAFDHLIINWNIHGHEPPHVFDIPHFDFHFYMITLAQQMAIPPYEVDPSGFNNLPPPASWPAAYFPTPGGVPQMGRHWISGSFAPPFTHTMIYGSYGGRFIFMEPMVTRQTLLDGLTSEVPYSPLQGFPVAGKWYPQKYNVYKDGNKHYVTLSNFTWH